jgi:hypothetical protein
MLSQFYHQTKKRRYLYGLGKLSAHIPTNAMSHVGNHDMSGTAQKARKSPVLSTQRPLESGQIFFCFFLVRRKVGGVIPACNLANSKSPTSAGSPDVGAQDEP